MNIIDIINHSIEFWEIEHFKETQGKNNPFSKKLIEKEIEEKIALKNKYDKESSICFWKVQPTHHRTQKNDKQDDKRCQKKQGRPIYCHHSYTGQEEKSLDY